MKEPTVALLEHRVAVLEKDTQELSGRVRALEIAQAKLIGYCAGGAFAGGLAFQILTWLVR